MNYPAYINSECVELLDSIPALNLKLLWVWQCQVVSSNRTGLLLFVSLLIHYL
jgi:hypothetical protein